MTFAADFAMMRRLAGNPVLTCVKPRDQWTTTPAGYAYDADYDLFSSAVTGNTWKPASSNDLKAADYVTVKILPAVRGNASVMLDFGGIVNDGTRQCRVLPADVATIEAAQWFELDGYTYDRGAVIAAPPGAALWYEVELKLRDTNRIQPLDTSQPRFLLDGMWAEIHPGTGKIAFTRFDEDATGDDGTGTFHLWIANRDGSGQTCISSALPLIHAGLSSWHVSGEWLICSREMPSHTNVHAIAHPGTGLYVNIWAVRPDGTDWTQLTDYATAPVGYPDLDEPIGALIPRFSADGTQVAWSHKTGFNPANPAGYGYWELVTADWSTPGGVPTLTNLQTYQPQGDVLYELWDNNSDTGEWLVAINAGVLDGWIDTHLWTPGSGTTTNTTGPSFQWNEQSFFSPDGQTILGYSSMLQDGAYNPANFFATFYSDLQLWSKDSDLSSFRRLTWFNHVGHAQYFARNEDMVVRPIPHQWLPDGTILFYVTFNTTAGVQLHGPSQVWMMTHGSDIPAVTETTVVIQPDSTYGFDTTIVSAVPTTNAGALATMGVGDWTAAASAAYRSLVRFDLSSIPADATIVSATVELYEIDAVDTEALGTWDVNMHHIKLGWDPASATWNERYPGAAWAVAGAGDAADVLIYPLATVTMDGTAASDFVAFTSMRLRDWAQFVVAGHWPNFGFWLAAGTAEYQGGAGKAGNAFVSSNGATASQRPKLTVIYS